MYKRGWWKVNFEITLDGEKVGFNDLSTVAKSQIISYIMHGCCQGEVEEIDWDLWHEFYQKEAYRNRRRNRPFRFNSNNLK